jgi:hypothetical protein
VEYINKCGITPTPENAHILLEGFVRENHDKILWLAAPEKHFLVVETTDVPPPNDEFGRVALTGRDAWARLDFSCRDRLKILQEVSPRPVIGDHLASVVWPHLGVPHFFCVREALAEPLETIIEIGSITWPQLA